MDRLGIRHTADHPIGTALWPTPELAYATAPSITSETTWVRGWLQAWEPDEEPHDIRLYRLRKAAVLDRIALRAPENPALASAAEDAAEDLVLHDHVYGSGPDTGPSTGATEADPRGYVRQEYAHRTQHQ